MKSNIPSYYLSEKRGQNTPSTKPKRKIKTMPLFYVYVHEKYPIFDVDTQW